MSSSDEKVTADNLTYKQLYALRDEAATAGDTEQVRLCNLALGGDEKAQEQCARVIDRARAMG